MKLNSASATALLLLLVPLAALADVTNGLVLQTNNALNLDTGSKVVAGSGDLLWTGSSLVPQGRATAVSLGALGISGYNALTEAALNGSKSAATSTAIPSSSLPATEVVAVFTNGGHPAKLYISTNSGGSLAVLFTTYTSAASGGPVVTSVLNNSSQNPDANVLVTGTAAIALFSIAACSHKVATVSKPPDITPVATAPTRPGATPAPAKAKTVASAPVRQAAAQPAKPKTMPAAVRKRLSDEVARLEDALFDYNQSTIRSDASVALRDDVNVIRDILTDYPSQKLIIEGHADERGSAEYNLALGDRRAHAVQEFLSSMGVPGNQLSVVSYGKERPVCTEESESCWQRNRRAHLIAAN